MFRTVLLEVSLTGRGQHLHTEDRSFGIWWWSHTRGDSTGQEDLAWPDLAHTAPSCWRVFVDACETG